MAEIYIDTRTRKDGSIVTEKAALVEPFSFVLHLGVVLELCHSVGM